MIGMTGDHATRFAYRNPLDLPRISYADIIGNEAEGVYVEKPETARLFRRIPPVFHDDPDGAKLFQPFDEIVVSYPPVFTTSLRDATLVGYRSVLSRTGFFTNDVGHLNSRELPAFIKGLGRFGETGRLLQVGNEGLFSVTENREPAVHLDGPVVLLTSAELVFVS